jgi:hypothetical protein
MQQPRLHSATGFSTIVFATIVALLVMPVSVLADGARKSAAKADRTSAEKKALSLIKYGTPVYGAMQTTLDAMHRKDVPKGKSLAKPAVARDADTSKGGSRIVSLRAANDVVVVRIDLVREEPQLEIGVYNMLGKKVQDVYRGSAARGGHEYTSPVNDLPEGVYICIMQGADFRRAEKFYLSR